MGDPKIASPQHALKSRVKIVGLLEAYVSSRYARRTVINRSCPRPTPATPLTYAEIDARNLKLEVRFSFRLSHAFALPV